MSNPTPEERNNKNNIRVINGKEYYYHFKSRRWKLVTKDAGATIAAPPKANVAESTNQMTFKTQPNAEVHEPQSILKKSKTLTTLRTLMNQLESELEWLLGCMIFFFSCIAHILFQSP